MAALCEFLFIGLSELIVARLEVSYTFLSWGEGNAKLRVAEKQRRENLRKSKKNPGIPQSFWLVSYKIMHDICMLLDSRIILLWAFNSAAKWE